MNYFAEQIISLFHLRGVWSHLLYDTNFFILKYKYRYAKTLHRIRSKVKKGEKINVLFLVHNVSKWKCQSLYEELNKHHLFVPLVALSSVYIKLELVKEMLNKDRHYYESHGCKCIDAYDPNTGQLIPLSNFNADIVFFQEPWGFYQWDSDPVNLHSVDEISKYALCMYMPYSLEWGEGSEIHHLLNFHRKLYAQFAWNEEQAKYGRELSPWYERSGKILGLGHTILDQLQPDSNVVNKGYVIYAPHFSFPTGAIKRPLTIGTFLWSGIPMLEYAQAHPEIKWVFKPHPKLKSELHEPYSGWTHEAVEKYYQDWERIAITCYNADYPTLFKQSAAMITDCASFLLEYAVTGKPIIRLYPNELDYYPRESIKPLFEIYYSAHNRDEMFSIFASVLEKHEDATRELRLNMLDKMQLIGINASLNIVAYITQLIK